MWSLKHPTIIIKKLGDDKFTWILCLSNNKKKPSCVAPSVYETAFKARDMAKTFAAKFKGPLRLVSKTEEIDELIELDIIDETRKTHVDGDVLDAEEAKAN